MTHEFNVWWLSQLDTKLIGATIPSGVPNYVTSEYRSRFGRSGRGRLWVAPEFGDVNCNWDDAKPACALITGLGAGGIVIKKEDVASLPNAGFVTTLDCEFVGSDRPPGVYMRFNIATKDETVWWFLIFGEFEALRADDWMVEVFTDGSSVRLYHPDPTKLVRICECFATRSYQGWSAARKSAAMLACMIR